MFDKLIGKKKKDTDIYTIPDKKYTTDQKKISQMGTKTLIELSQQHQKYIAILSEKIQMARHQNERMTEKVEELMEKNQVVNSQVSRMTNEHEQLTIKFDNLQTNLELLSSESQTQYKQQIEFLKANEAPLDKLKNMSAVLTLYREKFSLCKKIEQQNKSLKSRYRELEDQLAQSENKVKTLEKQKSYNNLIPSLMQEIQDLKVKNAHNEPSAQESSEKIEERILQKVKAELQTASTVRSCQEQEQANIKLKQAKIEQLKLQLTQSKQKLEDLLNSNEKLSETVRQYQQKVIQIERVVQGLKQQNKKLVQKCRNLENQSKNSLQKMQNEASTEAAGMLNELEDLKETNQKLEKIIKQQQQKQLSKQEQYSKLMTQNDKLRQLLQSKTDQLQRELQNRAIIENNISNQNNSEVQNVMALKNKVEGELAEIRKTLDNQKKSLHESQGKNKKLIEENDNLKNSLKRMEQEKQIIQQNVSNCLKIAQEQGEKYKRELGQLKKVNQNIKKDIQGYTQKIKQLESDNKNYSAETDKLVRTIQTKDNDLRKSYANAQGLQKQKVSLLQQISAIEEEEKIKARKYESQLNQERIKLESVNRKLTIFQNKSQQNKTSMDGMYEQLLSKDKKIGQMQIKLKQYKYRIQVLRKEKQQMESTYQNKLLMIPEEPQSRKSSQNIQEDKVQELQKKESDLQRQKQMLTNEVSALKEENKAILSENQSLRQQIQEMKTAIYDKERSIKMLQQKRDNIMKELEKIHKQNGPVEPPSAGLSSMLSPKIQTVPSNNEIRQKKIASKALKGFQIVLKMEHQLYKNFVGVFAQQMHQEKIKDIEKEINVIIKKSSDMRDVFEGYME